MATRPLQPKVPIWALIIQLLWAMCVVAFAGLSVLMSLSGLERWDPSLNSAIGHSSMSGVIAIQLRMAVGLSVLVALLAAACCVQAAICIANRRDRTLKCAAMCGLLASAGVVLVRVALPWEDPYTGEGSPLASAIGIAMLGVVAFFLSFPGFIVLCFGRPVGKPPAVPSTPASKS